MSAFKTVILFCNGDSSRGRSWSWWSWIGSICFMLTKFLMFITLLSSSTPVELVWWDHFNKFRRSATAPYSCKSKIDEIFLIVKYQCDRRNKNREDCISIEMEKKRGGEKIRFEKFQWSCEPFHSFRSCDTHKSPIEHLEMWMTPGNFPLVPQEVDA